MLVPVPSHSRRKKNSNSQIAKQLFKQKDQAVPFKTQLPACTSVLHPSQCSVTGVFHCTSYLTSEETFSVCGYSERSAALLPPFPLPLIRFHLLFLRLSSTAAIIIPVIWSGLTAILSLEAVFIFNLWITVQIFSPQISWLSEKESRMFIFFQNEFIK